MKLLLLATPEDESFLARFQRLASLTGHKVLIGRKDYENPVTLDRICEQHGIEGIFCTQVKTLKVILDDLPDFIPPTGKKKITLDDFAGSFIRLRSGIPVVVLNPLERLLTVAHESFVVDRYVSKITKPEKWFKQTEFQWHEITEGNRDEVLAEIQSADLCAIDIETPWPADSLRTIDCVSYTTYSAATNLTRSWVIPFTEVWHWKFIQEANATVTPKVFQNGLYDNTYFLRWGAPVSGWYHDTFHLFHSWLSELPKRLDFITAFCIREIRYWKDDGKTGDKQDKYRYCALDGWATINSLLSLHSEVPDWAITNYVEHEFPLVFPSINAALEGLVVDAKRFAETAQRKTEEVAALLSRIQSLLSSPNFNPGSPVQTANLFRLLGCQDLLKQPHLSERENANRGTGKIPSAKAKSRHPLNGLLLDLISEYRQAAKQVGTYFDASKIWGGLALYSLNPGGTATLRASSSESAFDAGWQIQNIPRDDPAFKECMVAPEGWFIAEADKAQSEARCVGYLSGEQALIDLVESDKDYHSWNAASFFGMKYEEIWDTIKHKVINKLIRDLAKRTNHGANYNMGDEVMLDTMGPRLVAMAKIALKLPKYMKLKDVCHFLLDRYNKTYPAVKGRWYQSVINRISMHGKLTSPLGWTRKFFGRPDKNKQHLNSAVAHEPQNLSVHIINKEWYKIWHATIYGELRGRVRIKAQIHDSLLFIYRTLPDAKRVWEMMDTRVKVQGSDGVVREMFIPSDLSTGDTPTRRWSEIK